MKKQKRWYDYLWLWSIVFFALGFFNILFAWLGMLDFGLPLLFAIFGGNKFFCNHLCGRGQLFTLLGGRLGLSRGKPAPRWMSSKPFRYGFLTFFMAMFGNMLFQTYLVGAGASSLREAIKLFWTFRVPWDWAYTAGTVPAWVAQFSFGFLQPDADLAADRPDRYGAVPSAHLVLVLSNGLHDTGRVPATPAWQGMIAILPGKRLFSGIFLFSAHL